MAKLRSRPKPGKKYDKAKLACLVPKCENEFFVSNCTTGIRICEEHFLAKSSPGKSRKPANLNDTLKLLGLI